MPQIKHPGHTMSSGAVHCQPALYTVIRLCTLPTGSAHCQPALHTANRPCTLPTGSVHCHPALLPTGSHSVIRLCTKCCSSLTIISKFKNPGTYPCRQFNGQGTCLFIPVVRTLRILRVGAHCLHIFSFQMFHRNFLYR